MKKELAETLLAKIMGWSDAQKAQERARLESFAAYKYDQYEQFSPGLRFVESLALWLRQFEPGEERRSAYEFVCDRLVFISNDEMNHLVELSFPTMIRPELIKDAATEIPGGSAHRVKAIVAEPGYRARLRRTLLLGLSDGARTDQFRRVNPQISNEQVFHAYDVSGAKTEDMVGKLKKDLKEIRGDDFDQSDATFQYVVLLDDFTASGTSYIRRKEDKSWTGKIPKIIDQLEKDDDGLGAAIAKNDVRVIIVIYVASVQAAEHIALNLGKLTFSKGTIELRIVHRLSAETPLDDKTDGGILKIAKRDKYFDQSADDEHGAVGGTSKRLGYAECRLPLVLSHNTPNNSIFLLWAEDVHCVRGLFPRVSRHRKFQ